MLVFALISLVATAPDTVSREGCTSTTYELEVTDYLAFGNVFAKALDHCATRNFPDMPPVPGRSYTLGLAKLVRFRLLGERFGLDLNLVTQPVSGIDPVFGLASSGFGVNDGGAGPDRLFVVPSLVLPESWENALDKTIDRAAAPVALVGGAAITAIVLTRILSR